MCRSILIIFTLAVELGSSYAQPVSTDALPQFEVASVKQNKTGERPPNNWQMSPGRIDYHNSQLIRLIRAAWGDFSLRTEGGPGWIQTDLYDVVVKFPVDTPEATRSLMLRALLIDRFKLSAHLETREVAIYSLVFARPDHRLGPKMGPGLPECAPTGKSNPPPQCGRQAGSNFIQFGYYDLPMVARILSYLPDVGRPVVDNTRLEGGYKIDLRFTPRPTPDASLDSVSTDASGPSVFTALEEQLGLKLVNAKGKVSVLVIDRVERPTPD